jgi:cyclopropane fatty-acyl-phospholipid synthase-like methyltransferase
MTDKLLSQIAKNYESDKDSLHGYFNVYDSIFLRHKHSAKNVLEIGTYNGDSLMIWSEYFVNANIYGLDNCFSPNKKHSSSKIFFSLTDAYTQKCIDSFDFYFDIIIDDGPHTIESQIYFVKNYSKLLSSSGTMVIEDILSYDSALKLTEEVPSYLKNYMYIINKGVVPNKDGASFMLIIDLIDNC